MIIIFVNNSVLPSTNICSDDNICKFFSNSIQTVKYQLIQNPKQGPNNNLIVH